MSQRPIIGITTMSDHDAAGLHAQSVDATIDRAVAAWAKVKTVRGTFDQTVTNPIVGSTAPFVGLFGTVWGIIDAFHGLGTSGTATLRSVAPGISEALVTTAAGLFAAIPAVMAYNSFLQRVKEFGALMDDFALEFINIVERHFA